jgi:hypothetical protein
MSDLSPLCAPKRTPPTTTDLWVHALENSQGQKPKSPVVKPIPLYPHLKRDRFALTRSAANGGD